MHTIMTKQQKATTLHMRAVVHQQLMLAISNSSILVATAACLQVLLLPTRAPDFWLKVATGSGVRFMRKKGRAAKVITQVAEQWKQMHCK